MKKIIEIKDLNIKLKNNNEKLMYIENFSINYGEIVFIKGNNGNGKSTLLNLLFTERNKPKYIDYYENKIFNSFSKDVNYKINKEISYLSQDNLIKHNMSVYDTLIYFTCVGIENISNDKVSKENKRDLKNKADEIRNRYIYQNYNNNKNLFYDLYNDKTFHNLKDEEEKKKYIINRLKKEKAHNLSGGQKKIVSFLSEIIKAEVMNSKILVLDEPLNNVDLRKIKTLSNIISNLINKYKGEMSYLIISHLMIFDFLNLENVKQYEINEDKRLIMSKRILDHSFILKDL